VRSGKAANINSIVLDVTRPGLEPMIYRTQDENANYYTTDAVRYIPGTVLSSMKPNTPPTNIAVLNSTVNTWSKSGSPDNRLPEYNILPIISRDFFLSNTV